MGTCCHTEKISDHKDTYNNIIIEEWYQGNTNFDAFSFNRSFIMHESISFQKVLSRVWKDVPLESDQLQRILIPKFNTSACTYLRHFIHKGTPSHLVRTVIQQILLFDEDLAQTSYTNLLFTLDEIEFTDLEPSRDPLFGRRDLTNCYLTHEGIRASKRLLYIFRNNKPNVEVSLLLPRLVQLFFWFFQEHEIYELISLLEDESRQRENCPAFSFHLPLNLQAHKNITSTALEFITGYSCDKKTIKILVKDILYNLLVGYIPPPYYPLVLCYFVSDGVLGLIKLTIALCEEIIPKMPDYNAEPPSLLRNFREISLRQIEILQLLKSAFKIQVNPDKADMSSVNTMTDFYNYLPPLQGNSSILNSAEKFQDLCLLIPKNFLTHKISLAYSLQESGFNGELLIDTVRKIIGSWILLIETKKDRVVGVFVDRSIKEFSREVTSETRLLNLCIKPNFYEHIRGEGIGFVMNMQTGILLKNDEGKPILRVNSSFQDADTFESAEFSSPSLLKEEHFQIYKLEIFELI